jgi:hypothetical protein
MFFDRPHHQHPHPFRPHRHIQPPYFPIFIGPGRTPLDSNIIEVSFLQVNKNKRTRKYRAGIEHFADDFVSGPFRAERIRAGGADGLTLSTRKYTNSTRLVNIS